MTEEHGTTRQYHRGCRCEECRAANTAYYREYRAKKLAADPQYYRRVNERHRAKNTGETAPDAAPDTAGE
jgi:hypothetical protein